MLGSIEPSNFAISIISNDINTLKKLPGIGPKTAQRIVLELKDKLKKEQQIEELTSAAAKLGNKQLQIRDAIEKLGGTMPEDLPTPDKSLKEIEEEQNIKEKQIQSW